ncbi:activator-dependent family glycosyltransferase [Actinosynnema sp. NPDC047251]|uniref:Glycosyltransferase, family 1 n=1 Tax=Saccharothrix espanaensis (strain ATCC 51144 / DSM 44229 / JCM 9112 / NBRC 15066 / NRRL 15764) TaxID=1179773 RepID=K0K963_SACES|nr:activator-dependent family glycosyltransferase [Saccharothrix espanaensis]CCH33138.1 Glycosyltransferase, family 1 [Saccharothrix espanaensis DSM 44229]
MRILLALNPEKTIFQYLVPLMWAARTAGHEVRVASQPAFAGVITQAGLTAVPLGNDRNPWRITAGDAAKVESMRAGIMAPYDAFDTPEHATWEYLRPGMAGAVEGWHRVSNFPIIADLVAFCRSWQPDLVLWEPLSFAAAIAAKACGAAHARILNGIDVYGGVRQLYRRLKEQQPPEDRADPIADWFAGYGRKYGFEFSEDMFTGNFTIDQFPKSLQVEADLDYVRTRYVPYGGPAVVPKWLWDKPAKPRVGFTMGLSATEIFAGYNIPFSEVLASLAELDIEVVATVAEAEQPKLGRLPDNVRLVSYVPWHALAPTCSAIVHHAGAATLATTALHAVPQLSLHYHYDQPILAKLLAEQGAGLEIHTSEATGQAVRDAVGRLLAEPRFRERAVVLREEIETSPTPNELVPVLEDLTAKHRAR